MKDSTIGKNNYTDILGKRSIFFRLSTTHTIQCTVRNYYIVIKTFHIKFINGSDTCITFSCNIFI